MLDTPPPRAAAHTHDEHGRCDCFDLPGHHACASAEVLSLRSLLVARDAELAKLRRLAGLLDASPDDVLGGLSVVVASKLKAKGITRMGMLLECSPAELLQRTESRRVVQEVVLYLAHIGLALRDDGVRWR